MIWILRIELGILEKKRLEFLLFNFDVNKDSSIEKQILALNTGEQMFNLPHLEEMNPKKKIT